MDSGEPEPRFPLDPSIRDQIRGRSKALFGNRDRLEVAAAIARAPDGLVNATDLAVELSMANNRVRAQLLSLCDAGLMDFGPSTSGKRWYLRGVHPFWRACTELFEAWLLEAEHSSEIVRRR